VNIQRGQGSVSAQPRQAEMVTRYGYWRGEDSEGCEKRRLGRRPGSPPHLFRQAEGRDTGKATNLKLVAGCNKPAELQPEKAVEVVRNHEDGTRPAVGTGGPKVCLHTGSGRLQGYRQGGTLDESQERKARANELARMRRNSERGAKTTRAAQGFHESHRAVWSEKPRRPAWKQAKARVGTGKAKRPVTDQSGAKPRCRFAVDCAKPTALKATSTSWSTHRLRWTLIR